MTSIRILHLEDSDLDAELIRKRLSKDDPAIQVVRVVARDDYERSLLVERIDLILADYSMPAFDGLSALKMAGELVPDTPFLFVSGALGEDVAIESLRRGATDYVLKHRLDRLAPAVRRALGEARERADRRRAQSELKERERLHRMVLGSIKDYAVLTIDVDGTIVSAGGGYWEVLGYREGELDGRPTTILFTHDDARAGVPRRELIRAGARGSGDDERWYVRKDGSTFWGSGLVTPMLAEGGLATGYVKVIRDMTDRKRVEEALVEADRRKDEFLAMLAHELRNPLSTINNAAELLNRPGLAPGRAEQTRGVISDQVKHLVRMVDDLLDVSRITHRKIRLRPERVDLAAVLMAAVEAARPLIEARGHVLGVALGPDPLPVEGDPTRLEQVFTNLLTNAAKYTEVGGRIELKAASEGASLVVRVRDTGTGIAPEMLTKVFDLFAQSDRSLERTQGGLGIGLTIVRQLVQMHGGTIEVDSQGSGMGSEFTVRLPAAGPAPALAPPVPRPRPEPKAGRRVLVVDDNRESAGLLAELLQLSGFQVLRAHDGRQALDEARSGRPEVVLLDIGLPEMDGYQVAERLRADRTLPGLIIIAISGYGEDQAQRRSRAAGFDHHLVKPVDFDVLLDLINEPVDPAAA